MVIGDLRIHTDLDALSYAVAQRWVELADASIAARGKFHVALSGGSTPHALYRRLANPEFAQRIPWDRVHIYFGDERTVPPDHADSNYRMAREALFDHVPIPAAQIFRIEGEMDDPHDAATRYARTLTAMLPLGAQGVVQFDMLLLGVGPDGHIASLFPGTPALHERARFVEAVHVPQLDTWRISITYPVIDHARFVVMLVSGENKASIMHDIFTKREAPPYPVQLINPRGTLEWHLDRAAATSLPNGLRE